MTQEFFFPSSVVDIGTTKVCVIVTNVNADENQEGPDNACKRALIKAFTTNTGLVWVNFGAAAVENACYPLTAAETVSVPLTNTDEINCLFKVGNEKVAVAYSN